MHPIKAVLIDLDGTLVHTAPEIAKAANAMLVSLGLPSLANDTITDFIGEGAATLIHKCLLTGLGVAPDAAKTQAAQALFMSHYADIVGESQPYPQVGTALQSMKSAGLKLACVTNKPNAFTLPLLARANLMHYFDLVVSGDTLANKKPAPDQIFYVCKQFDLSVQDVLLIGDSKTDVAAARNAGCQVWLVPYGYNHGQSLTMDDADRIIPSLSDAATLMIHVPLSA